MTTLPQTTPMRLPRPAGTLPAGMGGVPAGVAQGNAAPTMTGGDVWRVLRANVWLIVLCLVVFSAGGYVANVLLLRYMPRFTSIAQLEIIIPSYNQKGDQDPNQPELVTPDRLEVEARTHSQLLKSTALFSEVIGDENSEIRSTRWWNRLKGPNQIQDALESLSRYFDVQVYSSSKLLGVTMTDSDPDSCVTVLNAILNRYIKDQEDVHRDREYARNRELEAQKVDKDYRLRLKNSEIADLEADLSANGVSGTQNQVSSKTIFLEELLKDISLLSSKVEADTSRYNELQNEINQNQNPPEVDAMIAQDPQVAKWRDLAENAQLNLASIDPDNSVSHATDRIQRQYELAQTQLTKATQSAQARYRAALVEKAHQEMVNDQRMLDADNKRVEQIQRDQATLTEKDSRLRDALQERQQMEAKIKEIDDHQADLANVQVKHNFSGVEIRYAPQRPEKPSFPTLISTMSVSIVAGLVLAIGIAFLREFMDQSVRSPRDINRVGGYNLLGIVPHEDDDPQSAGARLPLVIFEAPHSMMAEQLRQVRTRLQHTSSLDTMRSIVITSPSPGDGKTTIACNLASGLALNGRRILLVDANFRRPDLHRIFNLSNEHGFSDALNSLEQFEHCVQETPVPNLFLMPSGPKPTNATELIESQLLVDFIERALEEYDHVIFDSGPILFVSEAVALAPRVDGVITVIRARQSTRGVLSRCRETLRQIKAENLGVVLNAVRVQGGGYYARNIRTYYQYQNGENENAKTN